VEFFIYILTFSVKEYDMPVSVNDLVKIINGFTVDTKTQYANVPNIKIKIINI